MLRGKAKSLWCLHLHANARLDAPQHLYPVLCVLCDLHSHLNSCLSGEGIYKDVPKKSRAVCRTSEVFLIMSFPLVVVSVPADARVHLLCALGLCDALLPLRLLLIAY